MTSIFEMIPNVIWASILALVFEKAEQLIGKFGVNEPPRKCRCPWKGCASRILPKGALVFILSKPMQDDNNGVISLSFWTSLTESNKETNFVFLVSGFQVSIRATSLRWILFMGYLPHESRPANQQKPTTKHRLHHSLFVKPEAKHQKLTAR